MTDRPATTTDTTDTGATFPREPWTARRADLHLNVVATGVLLGMLQWGVFFLLQSFLASTAIVYLLATSVWLIGGLAGLAIPGERYEWAWLATAALAYYAMRALAQHHLYDLAWLPPLLVGVAILGAYAGRFFRYRRKEFPSAKWLFFLENTGFIAGMLFTVIALYFAGESLLATAPAVMFAIVLATALPLRAARVTRVK